MNARENILAAIQLNQPASESLPIIDLKETIQYENLTIQFADCLKSIGGIAIALNSIQELVEIISKEKASNEFVVDLLNAIPKNLTEQKPSDLVGIKKAFIRGGVAVAENGSIWVKESQMGHRILPFIAEHLAIVIFEKDIVANMHYAMQKIDIAEEGFGVFLAGPSKTADIEQSLVIGAHGARSLVVYIMEINSRK